MARSSRPAPLPLKEVKPGEVFAMPLEDGRYGACRVLRTRYNRQTRQREVLVALSSWMGPALPSLSEPRLRDLLRLTHHYWPGTALVNWVDDPVPAEFVHLGVLAPTEEEARMEVSGSTGWIAFPQQAIAQWRWDHEHDAVLAEEEEERRRREASSDPGTR